MKISEMKKEARENLKGKVGKSVLILLAYLLILFALVLVAKIPLIGLLAEIAWTVISVPIGFGLVKSFVKLYNGEKVKAFEFFQLGFEAFGKAWGVGWYTLVKLLLPYVILIMSAIITSLGTVNLSQFIIIVGSILYIISIIWLIVKSYYYQLAAIIASDDEQITAKDAVNKSKELMTGNRGKLFLLELSFIGWGFLLYIAVYIVTAISTYVAISAGSFIGIAIGPILAYLILIGGILFLLPYIQFSTISFYKNLITDNKDNVEVIE